LRTENRIDQLALNAVNTWSM